MAEPLKVSVRNKGPTSQVCLVGEFDISGVGRVENALDLVLRASATRRVIFDLRHLVNQREVTP
jgi:hypothetical protein